MIPNRRKFLIGSAGISASLAIPHAVPAKTPVDPLSDEYFRYFAFLAHEHKQAWIEMQIAKYAVNYDRETAERIVHEQVSSGCWPMAWMPDEHPDIIEHCTSGRVKPMERAGSVLGAIKLPFV